MAIQNRRGQSADYVPSKLLPGEFAVSQDNTKLYLCFTAGTVKEIALSDDVRQAIANSTTALEGRIVTLENASSAHGNSISALVTRVGSAETTIQDHAGRILVLETDNEDVKARLTDAEDLIQQIQETLDAMSLNVIHIGEDVDNLKANAVRFDAAQNKTASQKLQARKNADAADILSLAPQYTVKAYAVGDMTTNNGKMYRCKAPIATGEQWTASHWEEVTVGSEISSLKEDFNDLESEVAMTAVTIPFRYGGDKWIMYATGEVTSESTSTWNHTDYVDVSKYVRIAYKRSKHTIANPAVGMAFYNASKVYISGVQAAKNQSETGYEAELYEVEVPENAVYARFSYYKDTQTYGEFAISGTSKLKDKIDSIEDDLSEAVKFVPQTLTEAQKTQARTNIGADSIPWFYVDEEGYMCQNITEVVNNGN